MSKDTWVPCPHEPGSCSVNNRLPNYYPLTANEIRDLFEVATTARDIVSYSRAVMRLVQGIPGMTCPYPAEGEVAEVMTWVEQFMADATDGDHYAPLVVLVRVLASDRTAAWGQDHGV
jgi:hypothetical protein